MWSMPSSDKERPSTVSVRLKSADDKDAIEPGKWRSSDCLHLFRRGSIFQRCFQHRKEKNSTRRKEFHRSPFRFDKMIVADWLIKVALDFEFESPPPSDGEGRVRTASGVDGFALCCWSKLVAAEEELSQIEPSLLLTNQITLANSFGRSTRRVQCRTALKTYKQTDTANEKGGGGTRAFIDFTSQLDASGARTLAA